MASTNKTTHYDLSQFVSSDIPAWLVDYNGDMSKIDTGIAQAKTSADTAGQTADTAIANASNAQETANTAVTNAGVADTKATTANTNIGTMADLETVEKTALVGAINEVNSKASTNASDIVTLQSKVIAESGNGYIRYEDGTQICFGKVGTNSATLGSWYNFCNISEELTGTLAKEFINNNYSIVLTARTFQVINAICDGQSTSTFNYRLLLPPYYSSITFDCYAEYIAIGKWK